ncbi:MAG: N-acetylglucosamine-6-phosphate deacetylase [bacterium]|nr:N-acetylglucosamine-6-phosphate deacetylase [bacterium]MDE0234561.1 N-acetylglucosamine-6-phosphate deacetylase [bacterium]
MRLAAMLPNGQGGLYCGRITVASGRIVDVGPLADNSPDRDTDLDFRPHVALPGFIDLQLNGAYGHDITTDPSKMWSIGQRLLSHGVTAFLPTVISSPPQQRQAAYDAIRSEPDGYQGAMPLGLHIEGPELAPDYAGVHPRTELVNGPEGLSVEFLREAEVVALVTIAPEVESASNSIEHLVQAGIAVSLGHTAATAAQASAAFDAGASALTHIFNGMAPLHHREVGAAGAGLLHPNAYVSFIADDHHLSKEAIRIAWGLAGPGRLCLVTDAMAGMGAPAGTYRLGSEIVECGEAARTGDGSLAGSLLTMPEAVRQVQRVTGATWDELVAISSTNPAALLGDTDRGRLAPGRRADIIIVDAHLRPVATMLQGTIAYRRTERISVPRSPPPNRKPESETLS